MIKIFISIGAHVTAVGSRASLDMMRELGADEVVDYRAADFAALGETWDVAFDTADASSFRHCRPVLTKRGRYVTLYASLGVLVQMLRTRWHRGPRALFTVGRGTRERTEILADLLARGAIRPVVAARFPIEQVADAHRRAEQGARGDIVVHPSGVTVDADCHARTPPRYAAHEGAVAEATPC